LIRKTEAERIGYRKAWLCCVRGMGVVKIDADDVKEES